MHRPLATTARECFFRLKNLQGVSTLACGWLQRFCSMHCAFHWGCSRTGILPVFGCATARDCSLPRISDEVEVFRSKIRLTPKKIKNKRNHHIKEKRKQNPEVLEIWRLTVWSNRCLVIWVAPMMCTCCAALRLCFVILIIRKTLVCEKVNMGQSKVLHSPVSCI